MELQFSRVCHRILQFCKWIFTFISVFVSFVVGIVFMLWIEYPNLTLQQQNQIKFIASATVEEFIPILTSSLFLILITIGLFIGDFFMKKRIKNLLNRQNEHNSLDYNPMNHDPSSSLMLGFVGKQKQINGNDILEKFGFTQEEAIFIDPKEELETKYRDTNIINQW